MPWAGVSADPVAVSSDLPHEVPRYRILGACNPPLAHQAPQADPDIGLLLPCNVIVREVANNRIVVGFLDPQIMVGLVGKMEPGAVADAAEQRLRRVCMSLGGTDFADMIRLGPMPMPAFDVDASALKACWPVRAGLGSVVGLMRPRA